LGTNAEPVTRTGRIGFRALGVPVIIIGLGFLGLSCWLAYGQWAKVAAWPRTSATLISKDISSAGARLVFQYEAGGRIFTGSDVRFGSEKSVRTALKSYEPGASERISYNPEDPGEVETILSYSWELFEGPISSGVFGVLFIFGGVGVYRWSYGTPVESPTAKI